MKTLKSIAEHLEWWGSFYVFTVLALALILLAAAVCLR
jgi:hypothetical protein